MRCATRRSARCHRCAVNSTTCVRRAEYRWGSGTARHLFCSRCARRSLLLRSIPQQRSPVCARCGITPFYRARSNPSGWAVTFQCLDAGTVASAEVRCFDGLHWEDCIGGAGAAIRAFSETD